MMRRMVIVPDGWPCRYAECRPGFFVFQDSLCLKSEYGGLEIASFCESGEAFWGGVTTKDDLANLSVQPVEAVWEEFEP